METEVAPVVAHCNVEDWLAVIELGVAVKLVMVGRIGWLTVTVASLVTEPTVLAAVILYVVVAVGDNGFVPEAETSPMF